MTTQAFSSVENIIKEYLEHKDRSIQFGKKRMDAEKEYNKLLTKYNGESKNYSLQQADSIYKAYMDMISFGQESAKAEKIFLEAEHKLREVGEILFEASITAEIPVTPPINGQAPATRQVTVAYENGLVIVK